ncbi:PilW family protein [Pseudomonas citronellolis]|uniref:PilW family protein n=1 Tax=Pseudomonas citronellolis TaxID=53408 RepID=UPI002D78EAD3|nr:prepilin-type N-terminal cleavage/methylation domain-containing protein [Pseudomonas citronellolis]WRT85348.1 prepilin-type N-terminal cleavage/methylation domain-containing protein [Pseudomonas citronellolis]
MRASHLQHGQRGLSLVELMVALLLGSVLIIGVTQLFLDQKRHAQFQFGQLANQGNARFATHSIERLVARAGYRARPQAQIAEEAFPARGAVHGCPAFAAGQTLALAQGNRSAALCVRYQRGLEAQEADCSGASLPFSTKPLNVVAHLALDSNAGKLTCTSFVEGGRGPGSASVLVEDMVDFSFQPLADSTEQVQQVGLYLLFAGKGGQGDGIVSGVRNDWQALSGRAPAIAASDTRPLQIAFAAIAQRNLKP